MPIDYVQDTCSPFWLWIAGVWQKAEGINVDLSVARDRTGSTFTSLGGHRYAQRAPIARRSWAVTLTRATPVGIAALAAAAEVDDVWLWSDATVNMLASRDCFGTDPAVDCGGLSLPGFTGLVEVTGRVRAGVPTTVSLWGSAALGGYGVTMITYPTGSAIIPGGTVAGHRSTTFTPTQDGEVTITPGINTSGLMLTEGAPPEVWSPGESMPCKVMVEDPAETLLGKRDGAYRSDYAIRIVEVD